MGGHQLVEDVVPVVGSPQPTVDVGAVCEVGEPGLLGWGDTTLSRLELGTDEHWWSDQDEVREAGC
jgi:hypothetical protein